MMQTGASASPVWRRILVSHRMPLCDGSATVKIEEMNLVGVGGWVRKSARIKPTVMVVASARTGSRRGMETWRVAQ